MSDRINSRHTDIEAETREWIERVVVGLDLCPFARKPFEAAKVRIAVTDAQTDTALLEDLQQELLWLDAQAVAETETSLLVVAGMLSDFLDYNDFLGLAEELLEQGGWEGRFQLASFHPAYQFAGTAEDDPENYTNRAPWPTLHLLREASVEQAVAHYPAADRIPERNIETMNRLGQPALAALLAAIRN